MQKGPAGWRVVNERGVAFPQPDEAAAVARFSLEFRSAIRRARESVI